MTKKSKLYHLRSKEKRDSQLKQTKSLILKKNYVGLLNNQKWYRVFEWIEQNNSEFELKTLLSSSLKKGTDIFELEQSSILIDNTGNFIEFFELEKIIIHKTPEIKYELNMLNIEFYEELDKIIIQGYRK